jgi:hypothetical protein
MNFSVFVHFSFNSNRVHVVHHTLRRCTAQVDTSALICRGPDGAKSYRLDLHGVELNVTQFLEDQQLDQFMGLEHVAIDTNNFDGEVNKIKAAGIKILEERVLLDGRRVCFFEGPQGVRLEFLEWK